MQYPFLEIQFSHCVCSAIPITLEKLLVFIRLQGAFVKSTQNVTLFFSHCNYATKCRIINSQL